MANLDTTCGNEGRLRRYYTWGVEPKARVFHSLGSVQNETDFGFRAHFETQERLQKNGDFPTARDGRIAENNRRIANARSGFFQNRFIWNRFTLTPGIRLEDVHYERTNRLGNGGAGVGGRTRVIQWIPGLGLSYGPSQRLTVFAGVHRGFAPPRVEDIISNSTGQSIELDPELSWQYEVGLRSRATRNLYLEGTFFRMDFENQIVPASIAGGIGATLTNAGRTLHQGLEFSGRWDWRSIAASRHSVSLRGAYTWVKEAEFVGARYSSVPGYANVLITGNRLPYAPEHSFTGSAVYSHATGLNMIMECVYVGRQFGDDLNTVAGTPDGQRGLLAGNAIWNATLNYPIEALHSTFFVTSKNVFDRLTLVDRTRGLLPGVPRLIQAGLHFRF
jgi:Fe(3+) dicitrate transport protein